MSTQFNVMPYIIIFIVVVVLAFLITFVVGSMINKRKKL
jgi:hypothetical protein